MNAKRWFTWTVLVMVVVSCALVLVWHGQRATAQGEGPSLADPMSGQGEAAPAAPVPGGPGFYSVGAFGFNPYDRVHYDQWAHDGSRLYNPGPGGVYYVQNLTLPQGATVSKFVVYFLDQDPASGLAIYLYRCPLDDEYCDVMAGVSSSGAEPGCRFAEDTSIESAVIDNQSNAYAAEVWLPASPSEDVAIIGIRVDYEYSASLPLVTKEY